MKYHIIEYFDWVDNEWLPVPDCPPVPEHMVEKELLAIKMRKKGGYRKTKLRSVPE